MMRSCRELRPASRSTRLLITELSQNTWVASRLEADSPCSICAAEISADQHRDETSRISRGIRDCLNRLPIRSQTGPGGERCIPPCSTVVMTWTHRSHNQYTLGGRPNPLRAQPLNRLAGQVRNQLEVLVDMEDCVVVDLSGRGDQEIRDRGGPVLTAFGQSLQHLYRAVLNRRS